MTGTPLALSKSSYSVSSIARKGIRPPSLESIWPLSRASPVCLPSPEGAQDHRERSKTGTYLALNIEPEFLQPVLSHREGMPLKLVGYHSVATAEQEPRLGSSC